MSLTKIIRNILLYSGIGLITAGALSSCAKPKTVVYYPNTVITRVDKEFKQGKVNIGVKGIPTGNIPIKSIELKVNDGNWIKKSGGSATFTILVKDLNNGTNTFSAFSINASGIPDPTAASTRMKISIPVIKANPLVTDEGSSLEARVNVYDKQYPTSDLTIDASSDRFNINNITKNGSWIVYDMVPKDDNFNGSAHLYIAAMAPDGLKTATDLKIKVNPMTDLRLHEDIEIFEHPSDNDATITGYDWVPAADHLIKFYYIPVASISSSPAIVTVDPAASVLLGSGYTDSNGNLDFKVKPVAFQNGLCRIVDTGLNREDKEIAYVAKNYTDMVSDHDVSLVTTVNYDWFRDFFTTISRWTNKRFNNGTESWPRNLIGHPPIYIVTGGKYSSKPTNRVLDIVKTYVHKMYPDSKVTITAIGDVANVKSAWPGKILIFFDPNILTVNNALSGFFFKTFKNTNTIDYAGVVMSPKYTLLSTPSITSAFLKEITQTELCGNADSKYLPYTVINPNPGFNTKWSELDLATLSFNEKLTKCCGDGVTGAIYDKSPYGNGGIFYSLEGYFGNQVKFNNIIYYVNPPDEPNI